MAVTSDGYWLVASDGGIFTFGDAGYHGSEPGAGVAVGNIIGIVSSPSGDGYWMEGSDGTRFPHVWEAISLDGSTGLLYRT
jgi:hypothetical protein